MRFCRVSGRNEKMKISEYPYLKKKLEELRWVKGHLPGFLLKLPGILIMLVSFFMLFLMTFDALYGHPDTATWILMTISIAFFVLGAVLFGAVSKKLNAAARTWNRFSLAELASMDGRALSGSESLGSCLFFDNALIAKSQYGLIGLKYTDLVQVYGLKVPRITPGAFEYTVMVSDPAGSHFRIMDTGLETEADLDSALQYILMRCEQADSYPKTEYRPEAGETVNRHAPQPWFVNSVLIIAIVFAMGFGLYFSRRPQTAQPPQAPVHAETNTDLGDLEKLLQRYADNENYAGTVSVFSEGGYEGTDSFCPGSYVIEMKQGDSRSLYITMESGAYDSVRMEMKNEIVKAAWGDYNSRGTARKLILTGEEAGADVIFFSCADSADTFKVLVIVR